MQYIHFVYRRNGVLDPQRAMRLIEDYIGSQAYENQDQDGDELQEAVELIKDVIAEYYDLKYQPYTAAKQAEEEYF